MNGVQGRTGERRPAPALKRKITLYTTGHNESICSFVGSSHNKYVNKMW